MSDLKGKYFKVAIRNMFKEIKNMVTEVTEGMKTMLCQIQYINKEKNYNKEPNGNSRVKKYRS